MDFSYIFRKCWYWTKEQMIKLLTDFSIVESANQHRMFIMCYLLDFMIQGQI